MSRCFPFPPPGYEKKPQSNSLDFLLKKKEKEHKKEKKEKEKEKEKKEGRERKDKERSKEKNREKKDRKEKRKDKDRKKDKRERRDEEKLRERNLEAVGSSNGPKNVDFMSATCELKNVDSSATWLGTKTDQKKVDFFDTEDRRADMAVTTDLKRLDQSAPHGTKPESIGLPMLPKKISSATISSVSNFTDQRQVDFLNPEDRRSDLSATWQENKTDTLGQPAPKKISAVVELSNSRRVDFHNPEDRRADVSAIMELKGVDRSAAKPQVLVQLEVQKKVEQLDRLASVKHSDQEKDRERNHKSKEKSKDKEEKKREKTREESRPVVKRERNGFLHENEIRPNKLLQSIPHSMVNGIKPDSSPVNSDRSPDLKKSKVNGQVSEEADILPHPREVQLSRLLQLPKLQVQMDAVDQDWLMLKPAGPRPGPLADGLPEVWAEAMLTGPEGSVALPYVVPF